MMIQTVLDFAQTPSGIGLLFGLLVVWPLWRSMRRAGLWPGWSLLVLVPVFGLALVLGVMAIRPWRSPPDPS